MDATLQALAGILLKGLPTFILFLLLHFYLRRMFFGPMAKVLHERKEATVGAKHAAADSLKTAEAKAVEFEKKIDEVRTQLAKEREATRKSWLDDQAARIATAKVAADAQIADGKMQLTKQVETARQSLAGETARLAEEIAAAVLRRSA